MHSYFWHFWRNQNIFSVKGHFQIKTFSRTKIQSHFPRGGTMIIRPGDLCGLWISVNGTQPVMCALVKIVTPFFNVYNKYASKSPGNFRSNRLVSKSASQWRGQCSNLGSGPPVCSLFSPCLSGFCPGILVSFHIPKRMHGRLNGHCMLSLGVLACVNSCCLCMCALRLTGNRFGVFSRLMFEEPREDNGRRRRLLVHRQPMILFRPNWAHLA